jgi:hypothetical protein
MECCPGHHTCPGSVLGKLTFAKTETGHRRCNICEERVPFLYYSSFRGHRCTPEGLAGMIVQYCKVDLTKAPAIGDFVSSCKVGRWQADNFICCMRKVESDAGRELSRTVRLQGNVEVDGSVVGKFFVKSTNRHYFDLTKQLNDKLVSQGQQPLKAGLIIRHCNVVE